MRTFTIESSNINIKGGRYKSSTPISAAKKAASRLFRDAKEILHKNIRKLTFSIRETTRGNNKNIYDYTASRIKLDKPVKTIINGKTIVNKYKIQIDNKSHHSQFKGGTYEYKELKFNQANRNFIIHIGDYCFTPYSKASQYDTERLIVNIQCLPYNQIQFDNDYNIITYIGNPEMFSVYQSRSELGCWRLCLQVGDNSAYIKGDKKYDYVQQTTIHPILQNFINKCVPHLIDAGKSTYCKTNVPGTSTYIEPYINDDERIKELHNHIDDKNRVVMESPFMEYNQNVKCGIYTGNDIREKLQDFSKVLEEQFEKPSDYEILGQNEVIKKTKYNRRDKEGFKEIEEIDDIYVMDLLRVKLTRKNKTIVRQTSNNESPEFILYYNMFHLKKFYGKEFNKQTVFVVPAFLTTIDGNKITKFGTFEKYVVTGNYVCKLFEYETQCSRSIFNGDDRCYGHYKLIGDIYNNVFPFNKLYGEGFFP